MPNTMVSRSNQILRVQMKVSDVPQAPTALVEIIGDLSVTLNLNVNIIQDMKGGCFITLIILCNILRRKIHTENLL